jgi:hypothetical protein
VRFAPCFDHHQVVRAVPDTMGFIRRSKARVGREIQQVAPHDPTAGKGCGRVR